MFDAAMLEYEHVLDFGLGTMPKGIKATFTHSGIALAAEMHASPDGVKVAVIPEANDPKHIEASLARLHAVTDSDEWRGYTFNLQFGSFDWKRVNVGRLRVAYLVAFAIFGYRYAFGSNLRQVRDQLSNVDEDILPVFSISDVRWPRDEMKVLGIKEPQWLRSIAIRMGRHMVFLPEPFSELTPYDAMKEQSRSGQALNATVQADEYEWPRRPLHLLDINPG